jgi:hypothetical protein
VKDGPLIIKHLIDRNWLPELYWENILHLQYVIKYADSDNLEELIQIITQPCGAEDMYTDVEISVWSCYLFEFRNEKYLRYQNVDKFLQFVSEKLGKSKVKELVLHDYHDGVSVIGRATSERDKKLVEIMLANLTEEDREEVRRLHVDTAVETHDTDPSLFDQFSHTSEDLTDDDGNEEQLSSDDD